VPEEKKRVQSVCYFASIKQPFTVLFLICSSDVKPLGLAGV
jgi:hypothetical protein